MREWRPRQLELGQEQHRRCPGTPRGGSARPRAEAMLSAALDPPPRMGVGHMLTASYLWRVTQAYPAHMDPREVSVSSRTF